MGCANSTNSKKENPQHEEVEDFLQKENIKSLTNFKVLLLGAGESGKSTVVKQLKVIHKVPIDEQEIQNYRITIHNNTITSMQVFIEASEKFDQQFEDEEKQFVKSVKEFNFEDNKFITPEVGEAISKLWKTKVIQNAFSRRAEFWNLDAAPYYFEHVVRFCQEPFNPTEEDCIMARVRTTGIVVTEFDEGPVHFSVVDVAGQRSERKKWIHCFDDVKCLVFVVSLAGYNQVMFEDATHNRMHEALNLFQQISNNPFFASTPIFLFLNKKDLFESMIKDADLRKCFPEYTGGADIKVAMDFIQSEFEKRMDESGRKRLHVHFVAARYKRDIKYTWEELTNVLVEENKKDVRKSEAARKKSSKTLNKA